MDLCKDGCNCCLFSGSSSDVSNSSAKRQQHPVIVLTYISSMIHFLLGIMCIVLGALSSWQSEIWMAHKVSPIWSGGFFILSGVAGTFTAKRRTAYLVMCYGALCVVSLVVGVVCIQLLKRGLVTHLSDGAMYRQDELEMNVILAMASCGFEILICIISFPICCQMAVKVKQEVHMKRDGTFSIQILGDKEIVIQQSDTNSYDRLYEDDTVSDLARIAAQGDTADLLIATTGFKLHQNSASTSQHQFTDMKQSAIPSTAVEINEESNIMHGSADKLSGLV